MKSKKKLKDFYLRRELTPQFAAAARKKGRPSEIAARLLSITAEIRNDILIPASKKLGDIKVEMKANEGQAQHEHKLISIATDKECEDALDKKLRAAFPDAWIMGEEKFSEASNEERLKMIAGALKPGRLAILTDALDGTRNFTRGGDGYAVMTAAIRDNKPVAAVVHRCEDHSDPKSKGHTLTWSEGDVVRIDGRAVTPLSARKFESTPDSIRGYTNRVLVEEARSGKNPAAEKAMMALDDIARINWTCAMVYTEMLRGQAHFLIVKPPTDLFDYPAGIALMRAAGGVARYLDGTDASFEEITKRQTYTDPTGAATRNENILIFAVSEDVYKTISTLLKDALGVEKKAGISPARLKA